MNNIYRKKLSIFAVRLCVGVAIHLVISTGIIFAQNPENKQSENDSGGIYSVKEVSERPKILYKEKAKYTEEARLNNIQGIVVLSIVLTKDGHIRNIRVIRGLPHGLSEKAIEAAQKIRFEPGKKDGKPVSVRMNLEYNFAL